MNCVLERLSVQEVFANGVECFDDIMNRDVRGEVDKCQEIDLPDYQPVISGLSKMLLYEYDFGDGWCVRITSSDVDDLIESERITREELSEAVAKLHETYRPVCIAQDGRMVLDDVGGIGGYVQFLRGINQKGHKEDRDEDDWSEEYGMYADKEGSLEWAKSLGWSKRRISNKNML
ncbi:MAG: hypothetical protein PHS82_10420, partial [Lachnospiraceae bacterium]|nr:hypothetical protein [Lachnospiraceae bacterium]